jgi:hypothetical protein
MTKENTSEKKDYKKKKTKRPPEPEGGPFERTRAFLEERFTRLRPKQAEEKEAVIPVTPTTKPDEKSEVQLPADFRRNLMRQYRQRQQKQLRIPEDVPPKTEGEKPENKKEGKKNAK